MNNQVALTSSQIRELSPLSNDFGTSSVILLAIGIIVLAGGIYAALRLYAVNTITQATEVGMISASCVLGVVFIAFAFRGSKSPHFKEIHDLHIFYDGLANKAMELHRQGSREQIAAFRGYLNHIHGALVQVKGENNLRVIDVRFVLAHLDGNIPEIDIHECADMSIRAMISDSFGEAAGMRSIYETHALIRERHLVDHPQRVFVAETPQREKLGVLFVTAFNKGKSLFIHSLAKRAHAAKMDILGTLARFLMHEITTLFPECRLVECEVAVQNVKIQQKYKELGFRFVKAKFNTNLMDPDNLTDNLERAIRVSNGEGAGMRMLIKKQAVLQQPVLE